MFVLIHAICTLFKNHDFHREQFCVKVALTNVDKPRH